MTGTPEPLDENQRRIIKEALDLRMRQLKMKKKIPFSKINTADPQSIHPLESHFFALQRNSNNAYIDPPLPQKFEGMLAWYADNKDQIEREIIFLKRRSKAQETGAAEEPETEEVTGIKKELFFRRRKLGLTMEELATQTETSKQVVERLEAGKLLTGKILPRVITALGYPHPTVESLLKDIPEETPDWVTRLRQKKKMDKLAQSHDENTDESQIAGYSAIARRVPQPGYSFEKFKDEKNKPKQR